MQEYEKFVEPCEVYLGHDFLGWAGLILPVLQAVERYNRKNKSELITLDVTPKLGGLDIRGNFYGNKRLTKLIEKAEDESFHVCEKCGAVSTAHFVEIDHWYSTLCNECEKEKRKLSADSKK
jgi:hypothetical protein